jgi:hypothetical protein
MDPFSHDKEALDSLRQINKELLVCGMSNVTDRIEARCIAARRHVLAAIHELDPQPAHVIRPVEEQPIEAHTAAIAERLAQFDPITGPQIDGLNNNESSRN